ncbi:class A beta-lactamase [Nitrospirillum sp. BR 11163]|uniref:class A beta-lactamase n=1 Tax=Nitrospirillum sp. BR 11163 TaxID=3104323 RepID=UPI002AFF096F|nr:class A beta-lactamase [Nitrospirillum sp. BR 11163]MEA1676599.1 class A beta-lactamase [Nitrospirillum sp. BR 11163]
MLIAMLRAACAAAVLSLACTAPAGAGSLDMPALQARLDRLTHDFPGRAGVAVRDGATGAEVGVRAQERFPEQSVFKLTVAIALLDLVDHGRMDLTQKVTLYPKDRSVYWQPLAKNITPAGWTTTLDDLMARMVADSDNIAADTMLRLIGGPAVVQAALTARGLDGIRVDRDERHLQSDILGLTWKDAYVEPAAFQAAADSVPAATRLAKREAYLNDPRDTAKPAAMALLLDRLDKGELLSPAGTRRLLDVLDHTTTQPHRLKAGLGAGWTVAHKPGAGPSVEGVTLANNDVGLMTAPDGGRYAVAVYVASVQGPREKADAFIADVARAVVDSWTPD